MNFQVLQEQLRVDEVVLVPLQPQLVEVVHSGRELGPQLRGGPRSHIRFVPVLTSGNHFPPAILRHVRKNLRQLIRLGVGTALVHEKLPDHIIPLRGMRAVEHHCGLGVGVVDRGSRGMTC